MTTVFQRDAVGLRSIFAVEMGGKAVFLQTVETVREQRYAINQPENFKELYGIGAAATDHADNVIGAFSVTGPEHSLSGPEKEASIADTVVEIVNEYELELALV